MGLTSYHHKRDFAATSEPKGKTRRARGHSFCIQKHDATRLHYDFRLELDGVLKSWAVPKGPSLSPLDRRLAVEVEDHPVEYGTFEGTIPKGNYGAGTVILWDRGTWTPIGDPHEGLANGNLKFSVDGKKLHGRWVLVRMKPRDADGDRAGSARHNNWLLIKERDEAADEQRDITIEMPNSVKTRRKPSRTKKKVSR